MTDDQNGTPLSRRLAADRKNAGLSQRVVAAKLTAPTPAVSAWENGHHKPGDDYLFALAELYGADPLEYVRLRMTSPSSGKAGERSRRQRAAAKAGAVSREEDQAAADAVSDGAAKINQAAPRTAKRQRRPRKPQT